MSQVSTKEPLFHIVKREGVTFVRASLIRLAAILLALVVCAFVIMGMTGMNPLSVYAGIWSGAVGTARRTWVTLRDSAILLCIGFAVLPAFRMRFWNIGAEGQVLVGAMATAAVMIYGANLPSWLLYALCPIVGVAAGSLWGMIPAFFKAHWNTNETLFTLMLNYIAIQLVSFAIVYWESPKGSNNVGLINNQTKAGWLPSLGGNNYLLPILIVMVLMVLLYLYMNYSKQGYEISVVGESENTARYAGINVGKVIIRTMIFSGALCGLTGFLIVGGRDQAISTGTAGGNGFTAIIVAWLAKFNTFTMALISFLLIFLEKGAAEIASAYNLNDFASDIIAGIILFFILGSEFFINYKAIFRGHAGKEVC